ncbi:hypothetical protein BDV28DRAFT_142163 [Aspergillus coremiiformis]|uniref:Uncharacterized protein n=1 Tax=Aspergillus coremiiformis TaxID=138285 RepID=A0A5N6YVQ0_9EURO|nr:hypothetical protein BDV28DRAFT_142163 [Aspergillus coremiiformis]
MKIYHDEDQVYRLLVSAALTTFTHLLFPYMLSSRSTKLGPSRSERYKPRHNENTD